MTEADWPVFQILCSTHLFSSSSFNLDNSCDQDHPMQIFTSVLAEVASATIPKKWT